MRSIKPSIGFNQFTDLVDAKFEFYAPDPYKKHGSIAKQVLVKYANMSSDNNGAADDLALFHSLSQIVAGQEFQCPAIKFLNVYSQYDDMASTYMYLYSHRISTTPWPTWYGVVHADELAMTLGQPISNRPYSSAINTNPWLAPRTGYAKDEKLLAQEIMIYLANFIKFNNPNMINSTHLLQNKHWPKYNSHSISFRTTDNYYLMFRANGSRVQKNFETDKCHFWNNYLPELMSQRGICSGSP